MSKIFECFSNIKPFNLEASSSYGLGIEIPKLENPLPIIYISKPWLKTFNQNP